MKIIVQKLCSGWQNIQVQESTLGKYEDADKCIPYITGEFDKNKAEKFKGSFVIGDGKYYRPCFSRSRKRRAVSEGMFQFQLQFIYLFILHIFVICVSRFTHQISIW